MIVPATMAVGGGSGAGGAAFRVGDKPPLPKGYVQAVQAVQAATVSLSSPLDILIGPLTPMGATDYDTLHAAQSAVFEAVDVEDPNYNYYDRILAMYMMYYRTGVEHWRTTARAIGYAWARLPYWIPNGTNGMPSMGGPGALSPKEYASQGLAVYYLDTGDTLARDVVGYQWLWAEWHGVNGFDRQNNDAREAAYCLMTACTAHLLGFTAPSLLGSTPATLAATIAESFITMQSIDLTTAGTQPNDAWQNYEASGAQVPALYFIENFMEGLVTESLIMYDRTFPGDARVLAAIKLCADWQWATQWIALGGGTEEQWQTSSSSVAIGTGTKTFTVPTGLGWNSPGAHVSVFNFYGFPENPLNPNEYMHGTVTSYSGSTLVLDVFEAQGTATRSAWDIRPFGYPLDQVATGLGCYQYANIHSGTIHQASARPYGALTGIMLPSFGYLYFKGQGASYKTNGDAQLASLGPAEYLFVKQYTQGFRSSPRYLGWTV